MFSALIGGLTVSRQDNGTDNYIGMRYDGMFLSFEYMKMHPKFAAIKDKLEEIINDISTSSKKSLPLGRIEGNIVVLNDASYDDITRKLCSEGLVLVAHPDQPKVYTIEDCAKAFSEKDESYPDEEGYPGLLRKAMPQTDEELLPAMFMRGASSPVLPHLYPQW